MPRYSKNILFFFFLLGSHFCQAQTTIYLEDFNNYPNGTTVGADWSVTQVGNCEVADTDFEFNVVAGAFTINDVEGINCGCPVPAAGDNSNIMTLSGIDISNYCDVFVNLDYAAITTDKFECADGGTEPVIFCPGIPGNGRDVLFIEAIIDGIAHPILFVCGDNLIEDNRSVPLGSGTTMSIRITGGTGSNDESYTIDNIGTYGEPKPTPTSITANRSTTICDGESITLTASGTGPFDWNTGSTDQSITVTPNVSTNYSVKVGTGCYESTDNQLVVVLPQPSANAGSNRTICRGESVQLRATGGSSYTWLHNGQTGSTITVSPTTTTIYSVTAFTGSSCQDTDQVTVFVTNPPVVTASSNQVICQDESVTLTAAGASSYTWSNGMSGASITFVPISSGSYTVTGTTNNCTDTERVFVTVNPNPTVVASSDITICEEGSATLTATGADTYLWSDIQVGSAIEVSPLTDEIFTVTGTRNGCSAADVVSVFVQSKIIANAGADQEICNGKDALLSATGGVTYEWSEGGATGADNTVSPTITTIYSVTATDRSCTDIAEVAVIVREQFELQSTPDTTICAEATVKLILDAPIGVSYSWASGENTSEIDVQPSELSAYSVTATDGICDVEKLITVDIDDINLNLSAAASEICFQDDVVVVATSNGSVMWSDGSDLSTRTFSPTKDTSYTAEAISSRGCKVNDEFILTVHQLPEVSITGQPYYCNGRTTEIIASSGLFSYNWADGNTDQTRTINTSGTYSVQGTDVNGCTSEASILIEQKALPEPMILGSRSFCPGSSTELSINQVYSSNTWNLNGDLSTNQTYTVSQNGSVALEVTNEFGCIGTIDALIEVNPDLSPVISGDDVLCENTIGQLDAGNGFDTYEWSTGAMTSTIDISTADMYSVTVSTNDGCSGIASIDIPIVANPIVEISGTEGFCIGQSTVLHIPAFAEISWSDGSVNDSITISQPGVVMVEVTDLNGCIATDQVDIIQWALPQASISGDPTFCEGDSTALILSSTDIDNITSILWDDGSAASTIYAKETAARSVNIEDSFGCSNTTSISVVKNLNPIPQIIAPSRICEGTETKLFTSEVYNSYVWNSTASTDSISIFNSGNYEIMVTDDNGCTGTDLVSIDGSEVPFIAFKSGLTLCNAPIDSREEPISINLDTAFTQKNVTGNWSSSSTDLDLSNLPIINFQGATPGTYEFTYTSTDANAPCADISERISIEVLDCLCPNVQIKPIAPLCSISDRLDLSAIQSSDFEGSWQIVEGPSTTLPSIEGDIFDAAEQMPGEYRLEFRLQDGIAPLGCAESKSVNIEVAPHIDASMELVTPACGGNEATFQLNLTGGDLYDVNIAQDNGPMISLEGISDGHTFNLSLNGSTELSFGDVTSTNEACGFQASASVYTFEPSQLETTVDLAQSYGDFGVSCIDAADGSAAIAIQSGTAPYTYNWSNGSTTQMVEGLSPGTYEVSVEDAIGCASISTIEIEAPPEKQLEIMPQDPMCGIGPGQLLLNTLEGIEKGQWELYIDDVLRSETQIPVTLTDIQPGTRILEAVNENGCLERHSFNIMDDSAYAIDLEDVSINLGQSAILQANFGFEYESILWSPSIYLNDSSTQSVFVEQPLNTTTYTIVVKDLNGCTFSEDVTVTLLKDRSLALPTGFTPNGDNSNDTFIIHAKSEVVVINNISVFDRWGEQVFTADNVEPNQPINWDWTFRNEPLMDGQYVWKANATFIDNEEVEFSGKFYIVR